MGVADVEEHAVGTALVLRLLKIGHRPLKLYQRAFRKPAFVKEGAQPARNPRHEFGFTLFIKQTLSLCKVRNGVQPLACSHIDVSKRYENTGLLWNIRLLTPNGKSQIVVPR